MGVWENDETPQQNFVRNMRNLRLTRGLSQEALAGQMTAGCFSWRQSTVHKLETDQRPLSLNEAVYVAWILGVPLRDMIGDATPTDPVPEHWPPQVGDVWVDKHGEPFLAVTEAGRVQMVSHLGAHREVEFAESFAPLRLVFRIGVDL